MPNQIYIPVGAPPTTPDGRQMHIDWIRFFETLSTAISSTSQADGAAAVFQRTTILTNDQIKALPTTGIEVIPTPGPNLITVPLRITWQGKFVSTYGNIAAFSWWQADWEGFSTSIAYIANDNTLVPVETNLTTFLTTLNPIATGPTYTDTPGQTWGLTADVNQSTDLADTAIIFRADNGGAGNYTGGHADNLLRVSMLYTIVSVP